jgi:hypothetical protein
MLKYVDFGRLLRCGVAATLLCGAAIPLGVTLDHGALAQLSTLERVRFDSRAAAATDEEREVRSAAAAFIGGMSAGDAEAVWMFASEEDQAAFATEAEILAAFADAFPVLTQAREGTFESFRREGDVPFVTVSIEDSRGARYFADIGLWLDDAGDWKVVSCDIKPASDQVASRITPDLLPSNPL